MKVTQTELYVVNEAVQQYCANKGISDTGHEIIYNSVKSSEFVHDVVFYFDGVEICRSIGVYLRNNTFLDILVMRVYNMTEEQKENAIKELRCRQKYKFWRLFSAN